MGKSEQGYVGREVADVASGMREVTLVFRGDFIYEVPSRPFRFGLAGDSTFGAIAEYVGRTYGMDQDDFSVGVPKAKGEIRRVSRKAIIPSNVEVIVVTPTAAASLG